VEALPKFKCRRVALQLCPFEPTTIQGTGILHKATGCQLYSDWLLLSDGRQFESEMELAWPKLVFPPHRTTYPCRRYPVSGKPKDNSKTSESSGIRKRWRTTSWPPERQRCCHYGSKSIHCGHRGLLCSDEPTSSYSRTKLRNQTDTEMSDGTWMEEIPGERPLPPADTESYASVGGQIFSYPPTVSNTEVKGATIKNVFRTISMRNV
jgi:hypothetical protein